MARRMMAVLLATGMLLGLVACADDNIDLVTTTSTTPEVVVTTTEPSKTNVTTTESIVTTKPTTVTTPTNMTTTTTQTTTTGRTTNELSEDEKASIFVFDTNNITRITFYSYYGQGKGSDVPAENMAEITNWLDSFAVGKKAPDPLPPGTNTYHVEIEYVNRTVTKKGLDVIEVGGHYYYLKHDTAPDCFKRIMAKTGL